MRRPLRQIREDMRSLLEHITLARECGPDCEAYFRREYDAVEREYDLRMMLAPNV